MAQDDDSGLWIAAALTLAAVIGIGIAASASNTTNNTNMTTPTTPLAYMDKYPYADADAFQAAVIAMAQALGVDPNWLMYIMYNESAGTFSSSVADGAYVGLIQMSPDSAKQVGTTTAALAAMTPLQQLQYVQAYFQYWINILGTPKDLYETYLLVFYPDAFNKPDTYTFPANVVSANPEFFAKTGNTKAAFKQGVNNSIPADKKYILTSSSS